MRFLSLDCVANREEENTKNESVRLFNNAKHSIKIIAGNPNSDFYRDEKVVSALKNAVERGVGVEIAYHQMGKGKSILIKGAIPGLRVMSLKKVPLRHMTSIDSKHVRIERTHPVGAKKTPAIICKNAPLLARDVDSVFTALTKTD